MFVQAEVLSGGIASHAYLPSVAMRNPRSVRRDVYDMVEAEPWHPPVEVDEFEDEPWTIAAPPARKPAPKPPKHRADEVEVRAHLIEIEIDELELHPDAPDLAPSWYHTLTFYVSFHPRSEKPDDIPLPRDPPERTQEGKYLVSTAQPARMPAVKVAPRFSIFGGSDKVEAPTSASSNPIAEFKEKLVVTMPSLDVHVAAYVWARKSTVASSEITLIGRSLAPLRDFKLQRRKTNWGVFDVMEGHRVAELRLKYAVSTSPGPVQKPVLSEVKQGEVTVKWSPPLSDHGAPVLGYQVSILLNQQGSAEPQWYILCERTKTMNPVYVVTNLTANTSYMMDIRAVNKVGAGDPCEFQITTAPTEADPPAKPWIVEARDGCLNVAWQPSTNDGGTPVTAYKIKMRKILGASKWNPFGPGESSSSWVDMGTVGAAMRPQNSSATYDAWVGPLETEPCEYRFQIVALNHVGPSRGSELSDPYFV